MRALRNIAVLLGFCKILDIVKLHIVKTTITILSQTIYKLHTPTGRSTIWAGHAKNRPILITGRSIGASLVSLHLSLYESTLLNV